MTNARSIATLEKTIAQLTTLKDRLTAADAKKAGEPVAQAKKAATKKTAIKKTPAKKRAAKSIG